MTNRSPTCSEDGRPARPSTPNRRLPSTRSRAVRATSDRREGLGMNQQVSEPTIVVRGDVPDQMIAYARDKLLGVLARTSMPVLAAELRLDHHADPARERPNHAEMTIDLDGVVVRARRSAPTMSEAIDRAEARLRRRVEAASERP